MISKQEIKYIMTKDHKEKLRKIHLGKPLSEGHKKKIKESLNQYYKNNIKQLKCCQNCKNYFKQKEHETPSAFLKRKFCSIKCSTTNFIRKKGNPMFGRHQSEESKLKSSKSHFGLINGPCSEDRKKKISERAKERWKNPDFRNKMKPILKKVHESLERNKKISLKNKNRFVSLNTRIKQSAIRQGIFLKQWKKFSSFEPYTPEFNNHFKNLIRKRDNQICMNCGKHREQMKKALNIHHINYNKLCSIPENCISLCSNCHSLTKLNRKYWQKLFQEKLALFYGYKYTIEGKIIIELNNMDIKNGNF